MENYEKKYKEALGRANAKIETYNHLGNASMVKSIYEIFPELKEKSEDERIRKAILSTIKSQGFISDEETLRQCVAWLEKQGEQKPADKIQPKFKVGDWLVNRNGYLRQVIDIKYGNYYCIREECCDDATSPWFGVIDYVENNWHKWTIADAKDGDVLAWNDSQCIAIFKKIYDKESFKSYGLAGHCTNTFEPIQSYHDIKGAHPATKEQRDLLFQKMKESGYKWNAEKKELRKIEKNPVWSEEDESNLQGIIDEIEANKHSAPDYDLVTYDRFLSWLKSLKDRLKGE